jgi:hypothetical protein
MDSDMINISLNQGKQFKNYQTKMKTGIANIKTVERSKRIREGFSNQGQTNGQTQATDSQTQGQTNGQTSDNLIQQRDERSKTISKANQEDMDRLTNLQTQYTDLQTQYNDTQKK